MSTLSNNSLSDQAMIAAPAALVLIGLAYAPARPLIGLGIVAALLVLFKPLSIAALRTILLAITPRQSVVVAKRAATAPVESPVQTAFALNRKANQVAQSNPALAAELRLRAFTSHQRVAKRSIASAFVIKTATLTRSPSGLNSEANRIAQREPQRAARLRLLAAYS